MLPRLSLTAAIVFAAALSGCATSQRIAEVTRFHLNQPIPGDTIVLRPAGSADPNGLEFRTYADAVVQELAAAGFRQAPPGARPAYEATLGVEQTNVPSARDNRSRVSFGFGFGGGGYRSGGGIGVGTTVPVGDKRPGYVQVNQLSLQIRRVSDASVVWEGRANEMITERNRQGGLGAAVPVLAHALLAGFRVPRDRRSACR